jgi:hypothetical protein
MEQLHVDHSQLRHRFECFEHCCEPADCESVVVAFSILRRTAETQFDQLLNSAQLFDSFVGDMAVIWMTDHLHIWTLTNDLELQMPVQRLSSESQCSTVIVVTLGNVVSFFPISVHSFERQSTKETVVTDWEMAATSDTLTVVSRNCISVHIFVMLLVIYVMCFLCSSIHCWTCVLGRQYGLCILATSSISFSMFDTVSPVTSPTLSGSPLTIFRRNCSYFWWLSICLSMCSLWSTFSYCIAVM